MITIAATVGFLLVSVCVSLFLLDFTLLNFGRKPILGLPDLGAARWLAGWLLGGVFLMLLTFPDLISGYKKYLAQPDPRGIVIDTPLANDCDEAR